MLDWLFAHPWGWFGAVLGTWCGGMLMVVLASAIFGKPRCPPPSPDEEGPE